MRITQTPSIERTSWEPTSDLQVAGWVGTGRARLGLCWACGLAIHLSTLRVIARCAVMNFLHAACLHLQAVEQFCANCLRPGLCTVHVRATHAHIRTCVAPPDGPGWGASAFWTTAARSETPATSDFTARAVAWLVCARQLSMLLCAT